MAAGKGRLFLLKVGDGLTSESFTSVGGMRTTGMTMNGEMVDVSDKDSAGFRELLAAAGQKSVSISVSGVFKDTASEELVRANFVAQTLDNYELYYANGDKWAGAFQVTSWEQSGECNGAQQYSFTLESSGEIAFTAA